MADILKPLYGNVWAEKGEKLSPGNTKIAAGWVKEMMPYQYENFLQNRTDVCISYLLQKGIAEWSNDQEYIANKSVVTYNGQLYMSTLTTTNILPTTTSSWKRLTVTFGTNGAIPIAIGGTGATSAADARINLGMGNAATVDLPSSNGLVAKLANNSLVARTITGTNGYITVSNGDAVSGNPVITVGNNVAKTDTDAAWTTSTSIRLPSGSTAERGIATSGRVRFNTELNRFEGYNGSGWTSLGDSTGAIDIQNIPTNGVQTSFTLNFSPASKNNIFVYSNGVYQEKTGFSLSGATITFSEPPAPGNLEIVPLTAAPVAPVGSWSPQAAILDAAAGTEIKTINKILAVMRAAGLILS